MSTVHTFNAILNTTGTYHSLNDFVQSTHQSVKQVYPVPYKANCPPIAFEPKTTTTYQTYGLPPSTAPSLSSSVSTPLSASSGDDEYIPNVITTQISPVSTSRLIERISLVDRLVGEYLFFV